MNTAEIQGFTERDLFRPFSIRLSNGARSDIKSQRDFGASKDFEILFEFPDAGSNVRIDTESSVEIASN